MNTHQTQNQVVTKRELINSLLGQIDHLKRELDKKNIISLLIKTRKPYLIQAQNISYNTKDDPSTEKFSSNSNFVIAIVYQTTVMILITLTL